MRSWLGGRRERKGIGASDTRRNFRTEEQCGSFDSRGWPDGGNSDFSDVDFGKHHVEPPRNVDHVLASCQSGLIGQRPIWSQHQHELQLAGAVRRTSVFDMNPILAFPHTLLPAFIPRFALLPVSAVRRGEGVQYARSVICHTCLSILALLLTSSIVSPTPKHNSQATIRHLAAPNPSRRVGHCMCVREESTKSPSITNIHNIANSTPAPTLTNDHPSRSRSRRGL